MLNHNSISPKIAEHLLNTAMLVMPVVIIQVGLFPVPICLLNKPFDSCLVVMFLPNYPRILVTSGLIINCKHLRMSQFKNVIKLIVNTVEAN